jgi:hypothetical protein
MEILKLQEYTKNLTIIHLTLLKVNFVVCDLYLNKTIIF